MTSRPGKSRDSLAAELEAEILSGGLAPGDRLFSERQLAERQGVSRPMVREALRILAERGLVEIAPGRGAFVRHPSPLAGSRPLDAVYRRAHPTAWELIEARLVIESETASLAGQRAGLDDVRRLERRLQALESASDPAESVRRDLAFHLEVAVAAHNRILEAVLASLASLLAELMVRTLGEPEAHQRTARFHREVYEAIAARDPERARAAMRSHLDPAPAELGRQYDDDLDAMALRALRRLGLGDDLPRFLRDVVPADLGSGETVGAR